MTISHRNISLLLITLLMLQSCVESSEKADQKGDEAITETEVKTNGTNVVSVGNSLFSIPSPVQTAILIESSGADYEASLPNSPQNLGNYVSDFDKAMIMGVYGADLAYTAIFQMNQEAITYLGAVEDLANDLDLANAIDQSIIKRFSQNLTQRDSMLALSSTFFRQSDLYLKENDRDADAALILVGGWVEGMYLAYNSVNGKPDVRQRIAEQNLTLENLIGLLKSLESTEQLDGLINQLGELQAVFKDVKSNYEFQRPEVKPKEKLTILKSTTNFEMTDEQLDSIGSQIESIRNSIVG